MEALPLDGVTKYEHYVDVYYCPFDDVYCGYFDSCILDKMQSIHVITIIAIHDDESYAIRLNERSDFLSSWESGVSEARNGEDMLYADYNNNQYAFCAGYQHWKNRNTKKRNPPAYSLEKEYVCHGFICNDDGEIWYQD